MSHYIRPTRRSIVSKDDLSSLDYDEQIEVMRAWFYSRYEDPENSCFLDKEEDGKWQFIWGGPYDAEEVLKGEFAATVRAEAIHDLVEELQSECFEWSARPDLDSYDIRLVEYATTNIPPDKNFDLAIADIEALLDMKISESEERKLTLLLFANVIAALETYLLDWTVREILDKEFILRRAVENMPEFGKRKIPVAKLYSEMDKIERTVVGYIKERLLWHNLPKARQLFRDVFEIELFDDSGLESLQEDVDIRHDIVHRNGKTKDGVVHHITRDHVHKLIEKVKAVVAVVEDPGF